MDGKLYRKRGFKVSPYGHGERVNEKERERERDTIESRRATSLWSSFLSKVVERSLKYTEESSIPAAR